MRRAVRQLKIGDTIEHEGKPYTIEEITPGESGSVSITLQRGPTLRRTPGAKFEFIAGAKRS